MTAALVIFGLSCGTAQAQLFGSRTLGSPLRNDSADRALGASVDGTSSGMLQGSERFLRGNRSRNDFVGSNRSDQTGFVGAGQAIGVGRVQSATEGLRIDAADTQRINRPLPRQPRRGMYYPRLEIAFDVSDDISLRTEVTPSLRIRQRVTKVAGDNIELTLADRTAVLRGTVESQHDADLATRLLSFEPGIDHVQNELQVRP